jgi:hypothetical protein
LSIRGCAQQTYAQCLEFNSDKQTTYSFKHLLILLSLFSIVDLPARQRPTSDIYWLLQPAIIRCPAASSNANASHAML